jgi:hypothetical protein
MRITPSPGTAASLARRARDACAAFVASTLLAACGISLGGGTFNDPTPTGTVIAQGSFNSYNGRTVTGIVSVWEQDDGGSCTHVVQLQSLSAPTDAGLEVVPLVNGATNVSPTFYSLRGSSGNQNYTFTGAACGSSWAQVKIIDPSVALASQQVYGAATLTEP